MDLLTPSQYMSWRLSLPALEPILLDHLDSQFALDHHECLDWLYLIFYGYDSEAAVSMHQFISSLVNLIIMIFIILIFIAVVRKVLLALLTFINRWDWGLGSREGLRKWVRC